MTTTPAPKGADIEQYRPGFEAWFLNKCGSDAKWILARADNGCYKNSAIQEKFQTWTAALSSTSTSQGALAEALRRLRNECDLEGLRSRAGFDCWLSMADKALEGNSGAAPGDALDAGQKEAQEFQAYMESIKPIVNPMPLQVWLAASREGWAEGMKEAQELLADEIAKAARYDYLLEQFAGSISIDLDCGKGEIGEIIDSAIAASTSKGEGK